MAMANEFHENGYLVIVASRNSEKVAATVKKYGFTDGFTLDVTNYENWMELRDYVLEKYQKRSQVI